MGERVLIAMSGGVDSSVAAARLVAEGREVIGVTLHLWDTPDDGSVKGRCCAPDDVHDAQRVCDTLGIPHFAFDRRELFEREVVAPFVESYLAGQTPSPCVRCNRGVKMRELLHLGVRLGAPRVATGHYARIVDEGGVPRLYRGRDPSKDQSYFLHMLTPEQLGRLEFPLGELTKAEVRAEAERLALPGAKKPESQELCFVPTGRYDELVESRAAQRVRPGQFVDESGSALGEHAGVHRFTVGQRRNLGVAAGRRLYVLGVDAATATVRLGSASELARESTRLVDVSLADDVVLPASLQVSVRYREPPVNAVVRTSADGVLDLAFEVPPRAVVPGQVAVLYRGDRVLGGGTIADAGPTTSSP